MARFIENVRSVSLDPVLMRRAWLAAYDFTTQRGAQYLSDYARTADPFTGIGERTVAVQVTSVVRASDRSFQVKWTETAYEHGAQAGVAHWTGILTIVTQSPVSADTLRKNPLGIYIDALAWSRELDSPVPAHGDPLPSSTSGAVPPGDAVPDARPSNPASEEIQP